MTIQAKNLKKNCQDFSCISTFKSGPSEGGDYGLAKSSQ